MKFGNIVRETSRYLTKITTLRSRRFLQPSIRLRYNYYAQSVAIKRGRMRVANLKIWSSLWQKFISLHSTVIVANARACTQGPFWLPWRIALVGQENQIEDDASFPPLNYASIVSAKTRIQRCLCREVDEIWQYRTGGNLPIFDKDHDTAEGRQK